MTIDLKYPLNDLAWFEDSPDAGHPDCICSYCGFLIDEDDFPFRLFRKSEPTNPNSKTLEARLHRHCFEMSLKKE